MDKTISIITKQASLSESLIEKVSAYQRKGLEGASNTQRAYQSDLNDFKKWCESNNQPFLPTAAVSLAAYASHLADTCKWSTICRRLAAISKLHQLNNFETPSQNHSFKTVLEGIKRSKGVRQKQAPAFKINELKAIIKRIDTKSNSSIRDKALLLLGFTGAFRRSEIVALNIEDLSFTSENLVISMSKSKTNQYGDNEEKAVFYSPDISLCPIRTLQNWIEKLERKSGALFVRIRKGDKITDNRLTDKTVDDLVKFYFGKHYSAHSLRASFITIAKLNGADDIEVMRQSKHKNSSMIQRYIRLENIKQHNAAMKLGL